MARFSYTARDQEFSPDSLDVKAFAQAQAHIEGQDPLAQFDRLVLEAQARTLLSMCAGRPRWSASKSAPRRSCGCTCKPKWSCPCFVSAA